MAGLHPLSVSVESFLPECSSEQRGQIQFWSHRELLHRPVPLLPDDDVAVSDDDDHHEEVGDDDDEKPRLNVEEGILDKTIKRPY